jgi:vacuolar-type H+-ATPase subunit C/Vma6
MNRWGPLVTRARGLSGHLLAPQTLRSLAGAYDERAFVDALVRIGYLAFPANQPPPDAHTVEAAIRRVAARRYLILARWSRDCDHVLVPILDDEDRRSIRALVRGALAGIAPEVRTLGLIPTATLPARALDELALLNDAGAVGAALIALRHPFADAVAEAARIERPDLFALDQAVAVVWARRAVAAARRGDAALRLYVSRLIDLQNLWTARMATEQRVDAPAQALFIPGGALIDTADIAYAIETQNPVQLQQRLRTRIDGTPLAVALASHDRSPDEAAAQALRDEMHARSIAEPLGLAPVLFYIMRLRAENRTLTRLLWQLSLSVPADVRARNLEAVA